MELAYGITRGIKNNNPFNIKKTQIVWRGELQNSSDPDFEQFEQMYFGLRAGVKLLTNYVRQGYNTPSKIINRYAPSSENDTKAYLDFLVAEGYAKGYDHVINLATLDFFNLVRGILMYESGYKMTHEMFTKLNMTL